MIRSATNGPAKRILLGLLGCLYAVSVFNVFSSRLSSYAFARNKQAASQRPETLDSLRSRLAAHIAQPRFASAAWGVKIVSLDSGRTIFEHNPQRYFNPASNAKL